MAAFFFSLLALTALTGAVVLVLASVDGRRNPAGLAGALLAEFRPVALPLAAVVAATSMFGSLFFSEVLGYPPCTLCWYQRIAMYPLAPILGIAAVRRDLSIVAYAWVLTASGALISSYHYLIQWMPDLDATACAVDNPCTAVFVREFGFVSIPFMAFAGFVAITVLLYVARSSAATDGTPQPDDAAALADLA